MTSNNCNCTTYGKNGWHEVKCKSVGLTKLDWKSGEWLKGMGLSGSQADYILETVETLLHSELNRQMELVIVKLNETMALFDYEHERNAIKTGIDAIQSLKETKQ